MGKERPFIGKLSGFVGQKPGVAGYQVAGNRCWAAASDLLTPPPHLRPTDFKP